MKIVQIIQWNKDKEQLLFALCEDGRVYVGETYVPDGNAPEDEEGFRWLFKLPDIPYHLTN